MKTLRVLTVVAAAFLLLVPAAHAQQGPQFLPNYFSLTGGIFTPESDDLDNYDADNGFAGFLTFGRMMNPFFGMQTDIGYFETSGDNSLQVSAIPIAVSVKIGIPIAFVEPYFLGGGGVYFCQTEWAGFDDNSTEFAPHVAGGVNFNFGRLQIGAEARYLWLSADDLNADGLMILGKLGSRF